MNKWLLTAAAAALLVSCATLRDDTSIAGDLNQRITASGVQGLRATATDRGVVITAGELGFAADSAELTEATQAKLDTLADLLKDFRDRSVLIEGHTADVGEAEGQVTLSRQRAQAVLDYLVGKSALTREQTVVEGWGGKRPVGDNATEEGRAQNRRVEIVLMR